VQETTFTRKEAEIMKRNFAVEFEEIKGELI